MHGLYIPNTSHASAQNLPCSVHHSLAASPSPSCPCLPDHFFSHTNTHPSHPPPPLPPKQQCASGSINQIPPHATVSGDCRVTPFYSVVSVRESIEAYVAEINADPSILPSRGPFSKYVLPSEGRQGAIELTWLTPGEDGIACNLSSEGAEALNGATEEVSVFNSFFLRNRYRYGGLFYAYCTAVLIIRVFFLFHSVCFFCFAVCLFLFVCFL